GGQAGEPELLAACYANALALAEAHGLHSIAFPAISTGVYGYPKGAATRVAVTTVRGFPAQSLQRVVFCCFSGTDLTLYRECLARI
ncbi:MAG: macro domain-containing protein, partial [Proteobacteria bacterium]|nr:macro domain-containing protein [Pseudomonadota bacterium]